ncbi:response regulator [Primorskyibacter sp. S187A]|uniref:response regulator n=1 Tax=Primorskyibacter sp. S187A TaxID=3415130 RepID=UPI003C7BB566
MLLEDDAGLRFTFSAGLESAGHDVIALSSCSEAIQALKTFKPDVLVLDLLIDDGSSIEVASFANYAAPEAEVVYVTGSGMFPRGELFNMVNNLRWVLRKPIQIADLNDMISHVALRQSETALSFGQAG